MKTLTSRPGFARLGAVLLAAAIAGAGVPASGSAQDAGAKAAVDAAKAQGEVGEQADGFLGLVSGGGPNLRAAVAQINAGRAQAYHEAAARSGVSAAAAGEATARQLFARLPPGAYYKAAGGDWMRR